MPKRYYWLKLRDNFFAGEDIKIILSQENGPEYVIFWLKLLLKSIAGKEVGLLRYKENIPYTAELLATVTDTNIDIVRGALTLFKSLEMIKFCENGDLWIESAIEFVGSETDAAIRMRRLRSKNKEIEDKRNINEQCYGNERNSVMPSYVETETDKELEKEKDNNSDIEADEESIVDGFEVISKKYIELGLSFQLHKIEHHCKIYGFDAVNECLKAFSEVDLNSISKSPEAYFMGMLKNYVPGIKITPGHVIKQQETEKKLEELRECGEKVKENKLTPEQVGELTKAIKGIAEKSEFLDKKDDTWGFEK